MKIERRYRIFEVAGGVLGSLRPALAHIAIQRHPKYGPVAIASNGDALAVVPVALDNDEEPSLIPATLLKRAFSLPKKKGSVVVTITWKDGHVTFSHDNETHDYASVEFTFPDYNRVIPARCSDWHHATMIAFNPLLMSKVCSAIGTPDMAKITRGRDALSPLLIEGNEQDWDGPPIPPFGVLMPMMIPR